MQKRFLRMLVLTGGAMFLTLGLKAQSIVGRWQLTNQTNCMDNEISMSTPETEDLLADMKSMSGGGTPQVIRFKDNNSGEETTRIISRKKAYNPKSFLYKYSGETLYILDKRSQTMIESFTVEKISTDSLIITNAVRACETKIFIRLK